MLEAITDGRTDLVFDYLEEGHSAAATDPNGVPLIKWCAYYGDVSGIKFLLRNGAELSSLGHNLDLNGAAFHGHWRLCQPVNGTPGTPRSRRPDPSTVLPRGPAPRRSRNQERRAPGSR